MDMEHLKLRCLVQVGPGPSFTKKLKSDRNLKHITGAKMCFTKITI